MHLSLPERFPLLCLFWLPLFASPSLSDFHPDTGGEGAKGVTYLGSLVHLCCGEGGRLQANITRVWGVLAGSGPHWVYSSSWQCALSRSTLLGLQVALKGNCPKHTLCCMHFPGLSCSGSGSRVLHKGTDSAGRAFCALPSSEQFRRPGAW